MYTELNFFIQSVEVNEVWIIIIINLLINFKALIINLIGGDI